jgi:hypothetical protein
MRPGVSNRQPGKHFTTQLNTQLPFAPMPQNPQPSKKPWYRLQKRNKNTVFPKCNRYLSRRITSPCPTIWSFNHSRYLYVAALIPGRAGPLSSRIPAGA